MDNYGGTLLDVDQGISRENKLGKKSIHIKMCQGGNKSTDAGLRGNLSI